MEKRKYIAPKNTLKLVVGLNWILSTGLERWL